MNTPYGYIEQDCGELELGELVTTDDGVELEVTCLDPITFEVAPEEIEDWGE